MNIVANFEHRASSAEASTKENPRLPYATGSAGLAITIRGSSRRIMIMRFQPANIRLINRRLNLPRLLLALSSRKRKDSYKNIPTDFAVLTWSLHIRASRSKSEMAILHQLTTARHDYSSSSFRVDGHVRLLGDPDAMEQNSQLTRHGNNGFVPGLLAASGGSDEVPTVEEPSPFPAVGVYGRHTRKRCQPTMTDPIECGAMGEQIPRGLQCTTNLRATATTALFLARLLPRAARIKTPSTERRAFSLRSENMVGTLDQQTS
jgi:hypothetical protein